jgi:glycerophosphoryl diester phosphodiesterase
MNQSLAVLPLFRSTGRDFWTGRRTLFIFELVFKLAEAWLLVPALAMLLAVILARAGHVAISNLDILDFLLTPSGLLYAALFSTVAAGLLLLEQAGVMALAALAEAHERQPFRQRCIAAAWKSVRILQLGALMAALLALALAPFLLLAALTYSLLLTDHDIYYYLTIRPSEFWLAVGIGGFLLMAALAVGAWLCVRWSLAVPILLFENQSVRSALRTSRERVRGVGWRVGAVLIGWGLGVVLLGVILEIGFRFLANALLAHAGERPVAMLFLLLCTQGSLLATLSFVLVVGLGLLTRRLYVGRSEQLGLISRQSGEEEPLQVSSPWSWRLAWLTLPLFLLAPLAAWLQLSHYAKERPLVEVTAHRGHARAAPENTLSAMRKAIESGADYAELDVQLTADGVAVLLHDRDLKRVAGVSRRLEEVSYEEVRQLDVGSWFDPAFAGERVPTLVEVIQLCRGRIQLNVEPKFFGPDRRLAREVARILREEDAEPFCLVTSLNRDALEELKRHNPNLRTGLTVAHALGDISRLDIEALSVRADFLTDELLRTAHRRGLKVYVWTINDRVQMHRQIKRGVDNIITSDPDLAISVRNEWAELTRSERLVLASRLLLGLEP